MLKNLKNKKHKKGFTLIELIIVIAIIAILAALAIPKFAEIRTKSAHTADIANAKTLANAASTLLTETDASKGIKDGDYTVGSSKVTGTDTVSADNLKNYLTNVPSPKTKGQSSYKVSISGDSVTVTMGSETLFPQP